MTCLNQRDVNHPNQIWITGTGFDQEGSRITLPEFLYLLAPYKTSRIQQDSSKVQAFFENQETAARTLQDLKAKHLGIELTVKNMANQHYQVSIGWKMSKLPEQEILEITTMCGHGMVSQHLTRQVLLDIKRGKRTHEEGANFLATPCMCGVFNQVRAQRLLEELTEIWCYDER